MTSRQRPDDNGPRTRVPLLPAALALADAVLFLFAVGIWLAYRIPFEDLTEAYLLGNTAIGASFALGGAIITLRVRRNAVGWLMLVGGTLYLVAAALGSVLYLRLDSGDTDAGSRILASIYTTIWMPAVAICMPAALQLFPTGRPINRFWRFFLVLSVVGGVFVTANWVLGRELFHGMGLDDGSPLVPNPPEWLRAVVSAGRLLGEAGIIGALLAPLFRLVRRPGEERLQVLWLVWAAGLVLVLNVPGAASIGPPPIPLLTIPLIPLAMTAAVLKYRLFGITLVINRTIVYLTLTAALLAGYFGVVYVLGRLIADAGVQQVLAAGAVAIAFAPLRALLQRLVDRLMFGSGSDPYGALAELGRRLQSPMTPDQVLPAVASTVADALKLPYVAVRAGRPGMPPVRTVEQGSPTPTTEEFPLTDHGEEIGALVVGAPAAWARRTAAHPAAGPRPAGGPGRALRRPHRGAVGVAAADHRRARGRAHPHPPRPARRAGPGAHRRRPQGRGGPEPDDAGPRAGRAADDRRQRADALGRRRRPPARLRAAPAGPRPARPVRRAAGLRRSDRRERRTRRRAGAARRPPPPRARRRGRRLPHRHRGAGQRRPAQLRRLRPARLWVEDDALHLEVGDDGATDDGWVPGVGLTSMRERTEELGGGFAANGSARGGLVAAWLPLATR